MAVAKTASGRVIELPAQNRVRYAKFGKIDRGDARLVNVPSSGKQQQLHWVAAHQLAGLAAGAEMAGHTITVASGWRPKLPMDARDSFIPIPSKAAWAKRR